MKCLPSALLLSLLSLLSVSSFGADPWHPAQAPLMTRWSKDVTPENVHAEYPRPQLVRKDWQNLNGLWDYAITQKNQSPGAYDGKILVPFPVESALSGVMKHVDEKNTLWYHRDLEIPKPWAGKHVLLHFQAVDFEATVTLNGKELGTHRGGYDSFSFDITDALKTDGPQTLVVAVWDPSNHGSQPRGKQVLNPGGIFYTPTSGIWQTVWVEPVAADHIDGLILTPNVDKGVLDLNVAASGSADSDTIEAVAYFEGTEVSRVTGKPGKMLSLPIKEAKLWSPDTPFLYDLKVELKHDGTTIDGVASYFGMRTISLGKDEKGITRPMLNGKFIFQVGPLDQGFFPDGLHTAPSDEAMAYDLQMTKKLGFNMVRKHIKIEPERWYWWCDKLGLLVWQDMPSGDNKTPEDKIEYERELKRMLEIRHNPPCIVMWIVFNEGWGQYDTEKLTAMVKEIDPSRLVNNASGWTDKKVGDVADMHNYPGPGSPKPEESRAAVLGEFGGLGLPVNGHTWTQKTWGYQGMANSTALTKKYVSLLRKAYDLKENPGLSAVVYTQTTDVETECNGLMTYDREVLKMDAAQVAAANRGDFTGLPKTVTVIPTAQQEAATWHYTLVQPAADWFSLDFIPTSWSEGPAGFGTKGTPGSVVRTEWKTNDIWLRRDVMLPETALKEPQLMLHHDDDAEVYINGVLAAKEGGYVSEYNEVEIKAEAKATLKPGRNIIAVHCHQNAGGQYIDVGIVETK